MRWAVMTVEIAPEAQDAVSDAFIQAGCGGVMLQGNNPVVVQGSLPVTDDMVPRMQGLRDHLDRLEEFGLPALVRGMTIRYAEEEDWANAWKKYFKPAKLGKRLVVKPSWENYESGPDELVLELDPGMAFGTGGHPTTKLCVEALEAYVKPGDVVADIGTGSGILALAAANLGATHVLATDIDSLPRKIARDNVTRNGLDEVIHVLEMDDFDVKTQDCDLIVANIVANTIVELAPSISPRLRIGGTFIASGIVEEHHDLVRNALADVGLQPVTTLREDIWVCLVSQKHIVPDKNSAGSSEALDAAARELPSLSGANTNDKKNDWSS